MCVFICVCDLSVMWCFESSRGVRAGGRPGANHTVGGDSFLTLTGKKNWCVASRSTGLISLKVDFNNLKAAGSLR